MRTYLGAAAALAVVAWIAAPWAAMARKGTLDEQTLEDVRRPVVPEPRKATSGDLPAQATQTVPHQARRTPNRTSLRHT